MNQVTKSLSRDDIARVEARNAEKAKTLQEAVAKAPPRIIDAEGKRTMIVDLYFPVEYDGAVIDKISIQRPTLRVWRNYIAAVAEAVKQHGPGADDDVDMPWVSVPAAVINGLDFVDGERIEAAQEGFFAQSTLLPADTQDGTLETEQRSGETETVQDAPSPQ